MKTILKISFLFLLFIAFSCSKDDNEAVMEPEDPIVQNSAPSTFDLLGVTDNAVEVDVLPTFNWNAASDPDGDAVTYDLYLDTGATADELYAENLTNTTFEVTERLALLENYVWRVVAKDSKGASTSSTTHSFDTRTIRFSTTALTDNAPFGPRYSHTSVVFENKMWVIGGLDNDQNRKNDVWYSTDGATWEEATNDAEFIAREGHSSVVFNNKIWIIGGFNSSLVATNDIWFSEDGITWQQAVSNAPFGFKAYHSSVVFDNKIWVIGGLDSENSFAETNDVWFSSDGITWSEATDTALFEERGFHSSFVYNNKIWITSGFTNSGITNDVWSSDDGVSWEEVTDTASFVPRTDHSTLIFDNKIWNIAGIIGNSTAVKDIWYSDDGINWEEAPLAPFSVRSSHTSLVYNNKVWILGGFANGEALSDVWTFD